MEEAYARVHPVATISLLSESDRRQWQCDTDVGSMM